MEPFQRVNIHDVTKKTGSWQDRFKIFTEKKTKTNVRIASELCPKREYGIHFQVKDKCRLCNDIETNPGPCCNAKEFFNRIENLAKNVFTF